MAAACGGDGAATEDPADGGIGGSSAAPWEHGAVLPAPPQGTGDPERGRHELLNGNFMSCGIPYKLWENPLAAPLVQQTLGADDALTIPGRTGKNATMPYNVNVFVTSDGAEVMNLNCLHCHGGSFNGELVVGLGDPTRDFTDGMGGSLDPDSMEALLPLLGFTPAEQHNTEKMLQTIRALEGRTQMHTVGNNPADSLAAVLIEHRHPETLAWSEEPLLEVTFYGDDGQPLADARFTSDPPPWWRSRKKHALFYNGMTRGDHRGTMAAAAAICVDNVAEAERVDALFVDIQAYVESVPSPRYPFPIDRNLAAIGKGIFEATCAGCHGTYADDPDADELDTYPNLLIPLEIIGTDPVIAEVGTKHAAGVFDIYNSTFYGTVTRLEPGDPFPGYTPPPLDGIWATAPYLHNASVPTLELVLNSAARPTYWKRVDYDSTHFDQDALGWPFTEVPYDQASAPAEERKFIYDTTRWSQSNGGHTFGDHLTPEERRSVLEYLKTL
jgi:mono/diheme cytochrome c family protein